MYRIQFRGEIHHFVISLLNVDVERGSFHRQHRYGLVAWANDDENRGVIDEMHPHNWN